MSQYVTLGLKRGTSTNWTTINPTLGPGEPGFELDTGKLNRKPSYSIKNKIALKYFIINGT